MTVTENLLDHLIEECAEVIQRVTKAKKFGLDEVQPDQPYTNAERIMHELMDVLGVYEALVLDESLPEWEQWRILEKRTKIAKYQQLSEERGILCR